MGPALFAQNKVWGGATGYIKTRTVHGKRSKIRYLPVHPRAVGLVQDYLDADGQGHDMDGALFRPVKWPDGKMESGLTSSSVYRNVVMKYAKEVGISVEGFGPHTLRKTGPPTLWSTTPRLPSCKSGWGTRIFR